MELAVWVAQEAGGRFLVDDAGVAALPLAHHVDRRRVPREAEGVTAERRAEIYRYHHEVSCNNTNI